MFRLWLHVCLLILFQQRRSEPSSLLVPNTTCRSNDRFSQICAPQTPPSFSGRVAAFSFKMPHTHVMFALGLGAAASVACPWRLRRPDLAQGASGEAGRGRGNASVGPGHPLLTKTEALKLLVGFCALCRLSKSSANPALPKEDNPKFLALNRKKEPKAGKAFNDNLIFMLMASLSFHLSPAARSTVSSRSKGELTVTLLSGNSTGYHIPHLAC